MATWIAVAGEKLFFLQYNFPTFAQSYAHPSPTVRTNSVAHQTIQCIHIFYPRPRLCIADFFLFAQCQQQFLNGSSRDTSNQNKFKILKKNNYVTQQDSFGHPHFWFFVLVDWLMSKLKIEIKFRSNANHWLYLATNLKRGRILCKY